MSHPANRRCTWRRLAAVLCAVALIAGCAGSAPRESATPATLPARVERDTWSIYVVRRGWHVDIGLPVAQLGPDLAPLARQWPGATYVLFGFGDRRYLMSRDTGSCSGLAALWPGPGLVLVTAIRGELADAFGESEVMVLPVEVGQEARAEAYIRTSLRAPGEEPIAEPVAVGPYDGSYYYAASAIYSGTHTCNTWAAEVLDAAGLPIASTGVVLAGQVWRRARRCAVLTSATSGKAAVPCPSAVR